MTLPCGISLCKDYARTMNINYQQTVNPEQKGVRYFSCGGLIKKQTFYRFIFRGCSQITPAFSPKQTTDISSIFSVVLNSENPHNPQRGEAYVVQRGMESESNVNKPHYNIALSKRTRKPQLRYIQDAAFSPTEKEETDSTNNDNEVKVKNSDQRIDGSKGNKKSLKQLIKMSGVGGGNTLGQHFLEEERQLQLAITKRQQEEASCDGTKFKGMMGHYVKLLSHLIKIKPGPHLKNKTLRRLTM